LIKDIDDNKTSELRAKPKWYSNPNYLFVALFSIPFIVYSFQWSTLYPPLSRSLLIFFAVVFFICLLLGFLTNKVRPLLYRNILPGDHNGKIIIFLFFFYAVDLGYSRRLPLLELVRGTFDYTDDHTFGIPVFHTIIVAFNIFFIAYVFHQYISTGNKKFLRQYLLLLIPFFLCIFRSFIILSLGSSFIIYLLSKKSISPKIGVALFVAVLFVLWGFGYFGNERSMNGDNTALPNATEATESYMNGPVPKEYYWTYIYVASPMANLQNNIDYTKHPEADWKTLLRLECVPEALTKFFAPNDYFSSDNKPFYQINEFLNVGTVFVYSFSYKRWPGIIFMAFYYILLLNCYYLVIRKSERFAVVGISLLCNAIIYSLLHNPISFSVTSMQLIFPVIFSFLRSEGVRV
jgi:hypothetical protein